MKAFTYYTPVDNPQLADHGSLVSRWSKRWQALGWQPIVLSWDHDALRHPAHDRITRYVSQFHGATPIGYRVATWQRWLAVAAAAPRDEPFLVTDYDVFNVDFRPEEAARFYQPDSIANLHIGTCVQPMVMDWRQAQGLVDLLQVQAHWLRKVAVDHLEVHDDLMVMGTRDIMDGPFRYYDVCYPYVPGMPKRQMIHLAQTVVAMVGKAKIGVWDELEGAYPCVS